MSDSHFHIDNTTKLKSDFQRVKGDVKKLRNEKLEQAEKDTIDVLAAGQDDTRKAMKEIEQIEARDQKEERKKTDEVLSHLDAKKRFHESYKVELAKSLSEMLMMLDWVRGWSADVVPTRDGQGLNIKGKQFVGQDGILLVVVTAKGNVMHQGMKVTGEPALDYAGLCQIALQTENTLDRARGLLLDNVGSFANGDTSGIVDAHGRPIAK